MIEIQQFGKTTSCHPNVSGSRDLGLGAKSSVSIKLSYLKMTGCGTRSGLLHILERGWEPSVACLMTAKREQLLSRLKSGRRVSGPSLLTLPSQKTSATGFKMPKVPALLVAALLNLRHDWDLVLKSTFTASGEHSARRWRT